MLSYYSMNSLRKLVIWLFSFLLCFSIYMSNSCKVLCIDNQGYARVETAHQQSCCDNEKQLSVIDTKRDNHNHHNCVDCSDISLDGFQRWQRSRINDRSIIHSFALIQATLLNNYGSVICGSSGHIWMVDAVGKLNVSIILATTVFRC